MSLAGFATAGAFLMILLFLSPMGWFAFVLYACSLLVTAAFGALFLLAAAMPHKFMMGVALSDDGFEFRAPLKASKLIRFGEIQRIEAVSRGDGDRGDDLPWRIYSPAGRIEVAEHTLYESGLRKALELQLPINRETLSAAHQHDPKGRDLLFGRCFIIYCKKQAADA